MKMIAIASLVASLGLFSAATASAEPLPIGIRAAAVTTGVGQTPGFAAVGSEPLETSSTGDFGEANSWLEPAAEPKCVAPPGCLSPKTYCDCIDAGARKPFCYTSNCAE